MSKINLVCFDWDGTIAVGHTHNSCSAKNLQYTPELAHKPALIGETFEQNSEVVQYAKNELLHDRETAFNNPDEILSTIRTLFVKGISVAIVSFNFFPEVIIAGLEIIGLEKEEISQIKIVCGFPTEGQFAGKGEHIDIVKSLCKIEDNAQVMLVDDNEGNCIKAKSQGINIVYVSIEETQDYLQKVLNTVFYERWGGVLDTAKVLLFGNDASGELETPIIGITVAAGYEDQESSD